MRLFLIAVAILLTACKTETEEMLFLQLATCRLDVEWYSSIAKECKNDLACEQGLDTCDPYSKMFNE